MPDISVNIIYPGTKPLPHNKIVVNLDYSADILALKQKIIEKVPHFNMDNMRIIICGMEQYNHTTVFSITLSLDPCVYLIYKVV